MNTTTSEPCFGLNRDGKPFARRGDDNPLAAPCRNRDTSGTLTNALLANTLNQCGVLLMAERKVCPEQGILIHEAPHVGWLIGCISPRPLHNYGVEFPNDPTNPSYASMNELFHFVGHGRADLFVVDW